MQVEAWAESIFPLSSLEIVVRVRSLLPPSTGKDHAAAWR